MVSKFLALPNELKFEIVQQLVPLLMDPRKFPPNYQTLNGDIRSVFTCINTVQRLAATCKDLRHICAPLLLRAVKLQFNPGRVMTKDDGSIDHLCGHTAFLSLHGQSHDLGVRSSLRISSRDLSIARVFQRFRNIVALELEEDFPLSVVNLVALANLGHLRTLSLRCPNTSYGYSPIIRQIHNRYTLPEITNLGLRVVNMNEAGPLRNVIELFERSIKTLSIEGEEYDTGAHDYIARLLFDGFHPVVLPNLEQLNIDFLEFTVLSLRKLIQNSPNLRSLTVDCRGADGFMPFFYMIDLMRMIGRERFDPFAIEWYDDHGDTDYDPCGRGIHMWGARVSRFICAFTTLQTAYGQQKVLDSAEIYISITDEACNMLTSNLRFFDTLQVFQESKSTFRALRSLVFGTANDDLFVPNESHEDLKEMTRVLCRECLPSASDVTIRWGCTMPFRCSFGQIYDMGQGEVWEF